MINVLFIHSSSELYGSDRSLLNIVSNIDKRRFNVYVVLPCDGPLVCEMKKVDRVHVEIFEVAVLRRKNLSIMGGLEYISEYCKSIKYLKNIIRKYQIDIVDTNTAVVFPGAIAAKKCGIKSAWHIREIIKSSIENKVISFMMNRYSDVIVANSNATGAVLKVNQSKIKVVYNAVDEKQDTEKTQHDVFTVGMAGRINRWKGQKLLVDAAEIVHRKHPSAVFKIAGEVYSGEDTIREDLVQYIKEKHLEKTVILLGQVSDMGNFYKGIDLFVLPSIQPEPFGLVVIEAMEYGLPVIATNHGGPVEIITNGVDGYLVDFNSATEMADRINEFIEDTSKITLMGAVAQKNKREKYSIDTMVRRIEEIFEELV